MSTSAPKQPAVQAVPLRQPAAVRSPAPVEHACADMGAPAIGFDFSHTPARTLQRKPRVGAPDDAFEREADAMADTVMRMAEPAAAIAPAPPALQRKCTQCRDEEEKTIRTRRDTAAPAPSLDTTAAARTAAHGGMPLAATARAFFEPRFGYDFSQVRVHADAEAAHAARSVQARAYTLGSHIVFGAGEYAPSTTLGRSLLAHELTHVVQQGGAGASAPPSPGPDASAREGDAGPGAGRSVVQRAAAGDGIQRKMHNKVLLEPVRPDAKACLVHMHGEEHTAAAVAQELYGRRCVNYVHLDTDKGPLSGNEQRLVVFDMDVGGANFTCKADPNRVFSEKGRIDDAIHTTVDKKVKVKNEETGKIEEKKVPTRVVNCEPTAGMSAPKAKAVSQADLEKAAAAELKTFADQEWAAGISSCRGGKGAADLSGPLPVLALHNNEGGDSESTSILSKYTGQWDAKDKRVSGANPNFGADSKNPSDVFFVTEPDDFNAIKDDFNVGIQQRPVPKKGEDGSLSVALQNQRFINVEKKGRNHAKLLDLGGGFMGHDAVFAKNYAMAVKALAVLGVPEGPCAAKAPAASGAQTTAPPAAPVQAPPATPDAGKATAPAKEEPAKGEPAKPADAARGKAEAEAKKKLEPYPRETVAGKDVPIKGCQSFDMASIGTRKSYWAAQIATLPVLDVLNWIVGAWNLGSSFSAKMPGVVNSGVVESFKQRDCLIKAMQTGVAAQKGSVPKGGLVASGPRSFTQQKTIWDKKWKFLRGQTFDRISAAAAAKSRGLLTADAKWDTDDPIHRLMWGADAASDPKDKDVAAFTKAGAIALTPSEREKEILMASSAPGISRHHAGTDFDIGQGDDQLEPELWQPGEKYFDLGRWLVHNAATWGFMRPFETKGGYGKGYMAEPWHWSYWPIAQALLEFARKNRTDMEAMLRSHWSDPAAGTKAQPQFEFVWSAWKNFLDNVDETPRF